MSVFAGIISGLVGGILYNRFHTVKLPEFLGAFSGSRFVPIVTAGASILLALIHHIIGSYIGYMFGEYINPVSGVVVTGDINRFFAGDLTAGVFFAGFYPVMMFGLPAVALAMYHAAKPENRSKIGGMLASVAFTSFLTGITEPIEFLFMFVAPSLHRPFMLYTPCSPDCPCRSPTRWGFWMRGLFPRAS